MIVKSLQNLVCSSTSHAMQHYPAQSSGEPENRETECLILISPPAASRGDPRRCGDCGPGCRQSCDIPLHPGPGAIAVTGSPCLKPDSVLHGSPVFCPSITLFPEEYLLVNIKNSYFLFEFICV